MRTRSGFYPLESIHDITQSRSFFAQGRARMRFVWVCAICACLSSPIDHGRRAQGEVIAAWIGTAMTELASRSIEFEPPFLLNLLSRTRSLLQTLPGRRGCACAWTFVRLELHVDESRATGMTLHIALENARAAAVAGCLQGLADRLAICVESAPRFVYASAIYADRLVQAPTRRQTGCEIVPTTGIPSRRGRLVGAGGGAG